MLPLLLQELDLSRCGLSSVSARAFRGLANLDRLDLSFNALAAVPTAALNANDVTQLRVLVLSGNPITALEEITLRSHLLGVIAPYCLGWRLQRKGHHTMGPKSD